MPKPTTSLNREHLCIHRCFMSEKWCTHERDINNHWNRYAREHKRRDYYPKTFVVMPFDDFYDQIFRFQIKPMLSNLKKPYVVSRADTVMRTGYVMCEKICRQIQESEFIVAEVSSNNSNVMYELGISVGLDRPILLMAQVRDQKPTPFAQELLQVLQVREAYLKYEPFTYILSDGPLEDRWWKPETSKIQRLGGAHPRIGVIAGDNAMSVEGEKSNLSYLLKNVLSCIAGSTSRDIILERANLLPENAYEECLEKCLLGQKKQDPEIISKREKMLEELREEVNEYRRRGQYGPSQAIDAVFEKRFIPWMHVAGQLSNQSTFRDVARFVRECDCLLIDTSATAHYMNFFWLGFSHAQGKSVIPVNVYDSNQKDTGVSTPFDIRGLWHVFYDLRKPESLALQTRGILKRIIEDKVSTRARLRFWSEFFDDVSIKIIVGATRRTDSERYMVEEWDYRTLAELVGFLSQEKPTLDVQIESPIYKPNGQDLWNSPVEVEAELREMVRDSNCIFIASPDVNVATDLIFSKAKGVHPAEPSVPKGDYAFSGYMAFKERSTNSSGFVYCLYGRKYVFGQLYKRQKGDTACQQESSETPEPATVMTFHSDGDDVLQEYLKESLKEQAIEEARKFSSHDKYKLSLGHLAVIKNPYTPAKRIIILSGSGPATMAMAQILTGCQTMDATVNSLWKRRGKGICNREDLRRKATLSCQLRDGIRKKFMTDKGVDFAAMSEDMLQEINENLARHGEIEALVGVIVVHDKPGNVKLRDNRRIAYWGFAAPERSFPKQVVVDNPGRFISDIEKLDPKYTWGAWLSGSPSRSSRTRKH